MLVTSSQSSTQRPLGLSVEELFALDRQYRRLEQQQQQHLAQLQSQARLTSSNLNRLTSRSLDLISSTQSPLTILPSLEIHGHGYSQRSQLPPPSSISNYSRSHSIDHLRYNPPVLVTPPPPPSIPQSTYHQRSAHSAMPARTNYPPRQRTYLQHPPMTTGPTSSLTIPTAAATTSTEYYDPRAGSCKLRRQHPIKRESSRRIVVRPVVQRRREPSISSSCESLDDLRSPTRPPLPSNLNIPNQSVPFNPSASLIADVIDDLHEETNQFMRHSSTHNDSSSDDGEINLYEMRVPIGKTYDTSDISVQLEGPRIFIHCHTIEPTDKRGNYRKHEFKTELLVPDVVDDETIIAYLTEDGQLIVEGKYQPWAWKEIKRKRKLEQNDNHPSSSSSMTGHSSNSTSIQPPPPTTATRNDGVLESMKISPSLQSNQPRANDYVNPLNIIEKLDNNRTVIHLGEPHHPLPPPSLPPPPPPPPSSSSLSSSISTDTKSVSDIIHRFNTLTSNPMSTIWDGQYRFTEDYPPLLIYHLRLPNETLLDAVRIQSEPDLNILKIFIEQQEKNFLAEQQQNQVIIRSTSRICRLPRDHHYDYEHIRVIFLKDNFIRIELPTIE